MRLKNALETVQTIVGRLKTDSYWDYYEEGKAEGVERPEHYPHEEGWEEHAEWQVAYLKDQGLQPDDRVLDYGCGTLRLGHILVEWLEDGNYMGVDLSADFIETARDAYEDKLRANRAQLFSIQPSQVWCYGWADVIWAQSVVTHVPPDELAAFFASVDASLAPDGRALATFNEADEGVDVSAHGTGFKYGTEVLRDALPSTLHLENVDRDPEHPGGQMHVAELVHVDDRSGDEGNEAPQRAPTEDAGET